MHYITVLEFSSGVVYIIPIPEERMDSILDSFDGIEEYLNEYYDFDLDNCQWMAGDCLQFKNYL